MIYVDDDDFLFFFKQTVWIPFHFVSFFRRKIFSFSISAFDWAILSEQKAKEKNRIIGDISSHSHQSIAINHYNISWLICYTQNSIFNDSFYWPFCGVFGWSFILIILIFINVTFGRNLRLKLYDLCTRLVAKWKHTQVVSNGSCIRFIFIIKSFESLKFRLKLSAWNLYSCSSNKIRLSSPEVLWRHFDAFWAHLLVVIVSISNKSI